MFNRKCVAGLSLCIALGMSPVNVYAGELEEIPVEETGELEEVLVEETDESGELPEEETDELEGVLEEIGEQEEALLKEPEEVEAEIVPLEEISSGKEESLLAEGDVEINETNFPDENFRQFVLETYGNGGLVLTGPVIENVDIIHCESKGIKSLKGIEYFTSLVFLDCSNNELSSLDVSGCVGLETLFCIGNQLGSLDISGCCKLKGLDCGNNQLTGLDVSGNPLLMSLDCGSNQITSLDISGNSFLQILECGNNQLTGLDVSNNPDMLYLYCRENKLTGLDVRNNESLERLACCGNRICSLDLSNNPALMEFLNPYGGFGFASCEFLMDGEGNCAHSLIPVEGSRIDISQKDKGFDPAKVLEVKHLKQEGSTFTLTGDLGGNLIGYYIYDCGSGHSIKVALKSDDRAEDIFADVLTMPGHWQYDNIKYVSERGIMGGVGGSNLFKPNEPLTRAMFATVLYRMAGEPDVEYTDKFTDVPDGQWYSKAILWANQNGIVSGYSDGSGRYGINDNITREQIAKMLHKYGEVRGYDVGGRASIDHFTDKDSVSAWAVEHIQWSVDAEMIGGKPNDAEGSSYRIDPKGQATRAECAKMLTMFLKKYE